MSRFPLLGAVCQLLIVLHLSPAIVVVLLTGLVFEFGLLFLWLGFGPIF